MAIDITTETCDNVTITLLTGRLDGNGAPVVQEQCTALVDSGADRLVMDLSGVEYISSAGLRSVLVVAKKVKAAGGALALCCLQEMVADVIAMSGFDRILTIAENRAAAIAKVSD